MEVNVFPAPAVAGILDGMIEARLHTDIDDEAQNAENNRLQRELTGSVATPIYVVQDPVVGTRLIVTMEASYTDGGGEKFARVLSRAAEKVADASSAERAKVAAR